MDLLSSQNLEVFDGLLMDAADADNKVLVLEVKVEVFALSFIGKYKTYVI